MPKTTTLPATDGSVQPMMDSDSGHADVDVTTGGDDSVTTTLTQNATQPVIYDRPIPSARMDEDALKVLRRLKRHGHRAYLVGGGVRDLLMDRKPKDFDIATDARPQEVRDLFRNCRVIGRRFRLAHILFSGGKVIEVATFRQDPSAELDSEDDAGETGLSQRSALDEKARRDLLIRRDNVFGEPHEDALRRDFTINGLFYDSETNEVIDYVGGLRDLEHRVIRTIGDPDVRFREDPIRILRALKFSARLDLGIDPRVHQSMVAHRGEITKAARPRLFEEVLRLLRGGAARRSFWLAWEMGVLDVLLPELSAFFADEPYGAQQTFRRLAAIDARVARAALPSDAILLCALLLGPMSEGMRAAGSPASVFERTVHPWVETMAIPRRVKDRMRVISLVQGRLRANKFKPVRTRSYFHDAASLFSIICEAEDQEPPEWAKQAEQQPAERGRTRKRRRNTRGVGER